MKATVKMERNKEGFFSCYVDDDNLPFGLQGYGKTAKEAREDLLIGYQETKECRSENGLETPNLEFDFQYDLQSFFNYFNWLNISAVAKLAGVNESLMRRYSSGSAKAGERQYAKINKAVRQMSADLYRAKL